MNEIFGLLNGFWLGFIVALGVLGLVVYGLARADRLPRTDKDAAMARQREDKRLRDLETTVRVLQEEHVNDLRRIAVLEERIHQLESQLAKYQAVAPAAGMVDFPLLAIFGPDEEITQADEGALNQSGVPFKCIYRATRELVAAELARRRRSNELYRWLHVATHAGPLGLLLDEGQLATREWWNKQLAGVEGVFLAGCTDVAVADWLIGVVKWVLSFTVEVDNMLMREFALVFWSAVAEGKAPREAYRAACKAVPQLMRVSDFRDG